MATNEMETPEMVLEAMDLMLEDVVDGKHPAWVFQKDIDSIGFTKDSTRTKAKLTFHYEDKTSEAFMVRIERITD